MKIFGLDLRSPFAPQAKPSIQKPKDKGKVVADLPSAGGRSSHFAITSDFLQSFEGGIDFVIPPWDRRIISIIRRLYWLNPDVGVAVNDLVQLTNTGHKVIFDKTVSPEQVDKMRIHLQNSSKNWGDGLAGVEGLVNKLIAQVYISGAISGEWVPHNDLTGINTCILINPEDIRFGYNSSKLRYEPYQVLYDGNLKYNPGKDKVKLNPLTYKYFGLMGDTNEPYGIPPFITALNAIATQGDMLSNIRYIVKQIGLLGFFEALLEKPLQQANESETAYKARLESLLTKTKQNIEGGLIDGTIVGYNEDHEFEFHSTTKNITGLSDLYNLNETQIANGLKYSPTFMGVNTKTEAALTIIFTKMLSQLKNVQRLVKAFLEYGYALDLRLAGYSFNYLRVDFSPSTITDDLKLQQAEEIKIRNLRVLYADGIISQDTYADSLGYEAPDKKEPRVPIDPEKTQGDAVKKKERKKDKVKDAGSTRRKRKEQPKDPKPRS